MLHYWSRFVVCWMCRVPWAFGSLQHPMARQVGMPFVEYLCSLLGLIGMAPLWCLDETARFLYLNYPKTTSLFPPVLSFFFPTDPWGFCWADFGTTIVHWQGWCGPTCWSLRDFLFIRNLFEDLPEPGADREGPWDSNFSAIAWGILSWVVSLGAYRVFLARGMS